MIYDILEKKLTDSGLVVAGVSLFRDFMPSDCTMGCFIRTPLEGVQIDQFIENRYRTRLQLITRHIDPVEGGQLASRLGKLLLTRSRQSYLATDEHGPAHIDLFLPDTLPIRFPRMDGNGFEWSQHFQTVFAFEPI